MNRKPKVLHIVAATETHKFNNELYKRLDTEGFENHFVVAPDDQSITFTAPAIKNTDGRRLHHLEFTREFFSIKHFRIIKILGELIRRFDFDIVHAYGPIPGMYVRYLKKKQKISAKIFYTILGLPFVKNSESIGERFYMGVDKRLFHYADRIFTVSRADRDYLLGAIGVEAEGIICLPGVGIDTEYFSREKISIHCLDEVRKRLGIPEKARIITFLGRPTEDKGIGILWRSFERVVKEEKYADLVMLIVGGFAKNERKKDVVFLQKIRDEITKSSFQNRVHFAGHVDDIRPYLLNSVSLVLPSYREGMPTVTLEAMALGIPVVVSNIPSCREQVEHGKNGYICDLNSRSFAEGITLMLDNGVELSEDEIAEKIKKSYSNEKVHEIYMKSYHSFSNGEFNSKKTNEKKMWRKITTRKACN